MNQEEVTATTIKLSLALLIFGQPWLVSMTKELLDLEE